MLDIEDSIGRLPSPSSNGADPTVKLFSIRTKLRKGCVGKTDESNCQDESETDELSSILPWNRIVYLRTWGCSHNNSDSEYMAGLLVNAGFRVTAEKNTADIWLLNSCTVKTPSETQLENQIREAKSQLKKVVVAGCVSQAAPNTPWLKDVSIVGVQQIDKIVTVVEETLRGNNVRMLSKRRTAGGIELLDLSMPKMRRNEFIEILAINSGCLNHCTYCKTKAARGDLRSFPLDLLVAQAKRALNEEGCRELWLTSEDLGAWGRDIGYTIPDLLKALIQIIPNGCMMRLGMTNPPYILDHLEEIAEILRHPRVYSFLHIPVQSGSDAVLSDMRREYTREHFCRIVDYMLKNVPDVYIATDFICAFPTETEEDFEESMSLTRLYKFPSLFINQFYPRPGTPAARLKKINTIEARRRTAQMTSLFHSYRRYDDSHIGQHNWVLICEMASDGKHYVGHNKSYEHILVPSPNGLNNNGTAHTDALLGKWAYVRVTEVSKFYMRSVLLKWAQHPDNEKEPEELDDSTTGKETNVIDEKSEKRRKFFPPLLFGDLSFIQWAILGLMLILLFKLLFLSRMFI